jgi:hypothetical protein
MVFGADGTPVYIPSGPDGGTIVFGADGRPMSVPNQPAGES